MSAWHVLFHLGEKHSGKVYVLSTNHLRASSVEEALDIAKDAIAARSASFEREHGGMVVTRIVAVWECDSAEVAAVVEDDEEVEFDDA